MRPFTELSVPARFRRLRRLALSALPSWGLRVQRVRPMTYWENATFCVDADEGRFLLRVHRPGHRTLAQIRGELAWLRGLAERSGLSIQQPLGGVVMGSDPGVPEPRACTLLSWADGRIHATPTVHHCRALGVTLAALHGCSEGWRPKLERPVWDCSDVFRMPQDPWVLSHLSETDWDVWRAGLDRLQQLLAGLGRGPDEFGLVHLDLHFRNLVFKGGHAVPIDFDDGGWGFFAMDLATPWMRIRRMDQADAGWQAFLAGYRSVRPVNPNHLALVPELSVLESLMFARWLDGQSTRPQAVEVAQKYLGSITGELREFGVG